MVVDGRGSRGWRICHKSIIIFFFFESAHISLAREWQFFVNTLQLVCIQYSSYS